MHRSCVYIKSYLCNFTYSSCFLWIGNYIWESVCLHFILDVQFQFKPCIQFRKDLLVVYLSDLEVWWHLSLVQTVSVKCERQKNLMEWKWKSMQSDRSDWLLNIKCTYPVCHVLTTQQNSCSPVIDSDRGMSRSRS